MRHYSNFAVETAPSSSIAGGDAEIGVSATTDYPSSYPFVIVVFEGGDTPSAASTKEMMKVTGAGSTETWAVDRDIDGYNGSGQSFTTSASVRHVGEAEDLAHTTLHAQQSDSWSSPGAAVYYAVQTTDVQASLGTAYFVPFQISKPVTIDSVTVGCTSAGTNDGKTQVAIFSLDDGIPTPDTKEFQWADQTHDSTGRKTYSGSTSTLDTGVYVFGLLALTYSTPPTYTMSNITGSNGDHFSSPLLPYTRGGAFDFRSAAVATSVTDNFASFGGYSMETAGGLIARFNHTIQ